jgi:hypothetical protein
MRDGFMAFSSEVEAGSVLIQSEPKTRKARFCRINVKATGLSAMMLSIHGI